MNEDRHIDWSLIEEDGVEDIVQSQARKVANAYRGLVEVSDLVQEAYIFIATHPQEYRGYIEDENLGAFAHALWADLTNRVQKYARIGSREVSYDALELDE